jgi:AcrR family transcriptional regulator
MATARSAEPEAQRAERARIIDASYRALAARRGESISVTDILRTAGLSTRAFYRHFDSKDALLLAMFRQESTALLNRLETQAAAAPTPAEGLRTWIAEFLKVVSVPRWRQRALVLGSAEVTRARGYPGERQRLQVGHERGLVAVLERGRQTGWFTTVDPANDARWLQGAIGQAFDAHLRGVAGEPVEETVDLLTGFAFRAVGLVEPA